MSKLIGAYVPRREQQLHDRWQLELQLRVRQEADQLLSKRAHAVWTRPGGGGRVNACSGFSACWPLRSTVPHDGEPGFHWLFPRRLADIIRLCKSAIRTRNR